MIVQSTDLKTNLGKYLNLVESEDITILRNGRPVAKMVHCDDWQQAEVLNEVIPEYNYDGQHMSYEAFIEMYEKTEARYELIDGQVYYLSSPGYTHQKILGNLYTLMRHYFHGKVCQPFLSPFDVILKRSISSISYVQPDLLVVCDPENRNDKDRYLGIPSLVVEILSISTRTKDAITKLKLYMATGIEEYWIINPDEKSLMIYSFVDREVTSIKTYHDSMRMASVKFDDLAFQVSELFV